MGVLSLAASTLLAGCGAGSRAVISTLQYPGAPALVSGIPYALPRGVVTITAERDAAGKVTITPVARFLPDPNYRYVASLTEGPFHDDKVVLQTTDGLLTSATSTVVDRNVDILKQVIAIITQVVQIGAADRGAGDAPALPALRLSFDVDPFDPAGVAEVNQAFRASGLPLTISFENPASPTPLLPVPGAPASFQNECVFSLCFRSLRTVVLEGRLNGRMVLRQELPLPDPNSLFGYDIVRDACVTNITNLTFTQGVLTKVDVDAKSEVLGCLSIPLEIARAILSVPAAALDIRITQINDDKELAQAQTQLLDAQRLLLQAQAAQAAAAAARPPQPPTPPSP